MASAILLILINLSIILAIYTITRLTFLIYHFPKFSNESQIDILYALIWGIRFDLSSILLINFVFILIVLTFSFFNKGLQVLKWLKWPYIFTNSLAIIINVGDIEYFNFTGRRLTREVLFIGHEIKDQFFQLIFYYWPLVLFTAILITIFYYSTKIKIPSLRLNKIQATFLFFSLLVFTALGARGGWQLKPLHPSHAFIFKSNMLSYLSLNSPFTFIKSKIGKEFKRREYFIDRQSALAQIQFENRFQSSQSNFIKFNQQNVYIIILESFALEYLGVANNEKGYTPFLDELAKDSLFFENCFANGRRSIEAIPSILSAIPSLNNQPFITSDFQSNQITGLGHLFAKNGYSTHFFHGGENGTMFFDSFSRRIGFQYYYGYNEYPHKQRDFDGNWGIYDEPFFKYSIEQLNKLTSPFLSVLFTLSSHQPYSIPPELKNKFPKGTLEIHESIGYTDYSLQKFFEEAEKTDWYKNTLFIITADHTQKSDNSKYANDLGPYRVPLILFHPNMKWPEIDTHKIVQHIDIAPTIIDMMGFESEKFQIFGQSIFSQNPGRAYNFNGYNYWLLDKNFFVKWDEQNSPEVFRHNNTQNFVKIDPTTDDTHSSFQTLKAITQLYINGLIDNSL